MSQSGLDPRLAAGDEAIDIGSAGAIMRCVVISLREPMISGISKNNRKKKSRADTLL